MTSDGTAVVIVLVVTMGSVATGTEGNALEKEIPNAKAHRAISVRGLIMPRARRRLKLSRRILEAKSKGLEIEKMVSEKSERLLTYPCSSHCPSLEPCLLRLKDNPRVGKRMPYQWFVTVDPRKISSHPSTYNLCLYG